MMNLLKLVKVFSFLGLLISSAAIGQSIIWEENGLDISNLNTGVYIVNINTDNNNSIDKKVIIN